MINTCFHTLLTTVLGKKLLTATTEHSEFRQELRLVICQTPDTDILSGSV